MAERSGCWGLVFSGDTATATSLAVHSAAVNSCWLRIGVWVAGLEAQLAAEQLTVFDHAISGRTLGITRFYEDAEQIESRLLGNRVEARHRSPTELRPLQPLLPIFVYVEEGLFHPIIGRFTFTGEGTGGKMVRVAGDEALKPDGVDRMVQRILGA
jgi:hypothetical protein